MLLTNSATKLVVSVSSTGSELILAVPKKKKKNSAQLMSIRMTFYVFSFYPLPT